MGFFANKFIISAEKVILRHDGVFYNSGRTGRLFSKKQVSDSFREDEQAHE